MIFIYLSNTIVIENKELCRTTKQLSGPMAEARFNRNEIGRRKMSAIVQYFTGVQNSHLPEYFGPTSEFYNYYYIFLIFTYFIYFFRTHFGL